MNSVIVENGRYTVDSLYQWDKNQELEIRGLSLPSIPEIHFTNEAMDKSIPRQATMNDAGIITVMIPNSLLQKPYTIKAYVCIYEGDTFKSLYAVNIPVKARKQPIDYTIENDEEIYSFNRLENLLNNTVTNLVEEYTKVEARYNEVNAKYEETDKKYTDAVISLETASAKAEESKKNYDDAAKAYADASKILENSSDILETLNTKANKSTVVTATLSASGWIGNTYSFESAYPSSAYDIEISLNSTATAVQAETFNSAQIVGSATTNVVTAFGEVPTVDIPIIIKAVAK